MEGKGQSMCFLYNVTQAFMNRPFWDKSKTKRISCKLWICFPTRVYKKTVPIKLRICYSAGAIPLSLCKKCLMKWVAAIGIETWAEPQRSSGKFLWGSAFWATSVLSWLHQTVLYARGLSCVHVTSQMRVLRKHTLDVYKFLYNVDP